MFGLSKKENGLKIIIVGCGKVGANLVDQLSKEGHDITVIDKKAEKIQDITNTYDVMGLVGNGASYSTQMEAGIEETDLIIAVTDSDATVDADVRNGRRSIDKVNIDTKKKVAEVNDFCYFFLFKHLPRVCRTHLLRFYLLHVFLSVLDVDALS